jgi:hypothetical protein
MATTKVTDGLINAMGKGGDISSASPTVIDVDGGFFDIVGTTSFSAFTVASGRLFTCQFDGALTITHGSGIELSGAANITTATGDRLTFYSVAANTVVEVSRTLEAAAAAGGAWVLIEEQIVSGSVSSVDFETGIDSTYEHYVFVISGYTHLGNGNANWIRVGTGGTPTYQTSAYEYHNGKVTAASDAYSATIWSAGYSDVSIWYGENLSTTSTDESDAVIHMFNPANAAYFTKFVWQGTSGTDAAQQYNSGTGKYDSVTAVTAVRFLSEASNIDGGTFKLYGIAGA